MPFDLIALIGPTASGKSGLAVRLALELGEQGVPVEIINADAMQLYRGMDIGTAKLPVSERGGIPHHLFDIFDPSQDVSVFEYQGLARQKAAELLARGVTPMFVGGSMFYLSAALDEFDFAPREPSVRAALEAKSDSLGAPEMHRLLASLDPVAAGQIPAENNRRVLRALEVIELTGEPYAATLPAPVHVLPTLQIGIAVERELLRQTIADRVQIMWQKGLVAEVAALEAAGVTLGPTAARAIGYAQARRQLLGELTQDQAIAETTQLTQRYAKRQLSWFRRDTRTQWLPIGQLAPELTSGALELIRLAQ